MGNSDKKEAFKMATKEHFKAYDEKMIALDAQMRECKRVGGEKFAEICKLYESDLTFGEIDTIVKGLI